jgi:hypothetical protein
MLTEGLVSLVEGQNGMARKWIVAGVLWAMVGATIVNAEESPARPPARAAEGNGTFSVLRTIAYLPFKGVVCVVGAVASFPVYLLSGMDPQVKNDTDAMREKYCSQEYLFGAEWSR